MRKLVHLPTTLFCTDTCDQYAGMSQPSATLPPNSCLVAILLVIKTRAGPRLVFHYPPCPFATAATTGLDAAWYGTPGPNAINSDSSGSDWSSDDGDTTGDEDGTNGSKAGSRHDTPGSVKSSRAKRTPAGIRDEVGEEFVERVRDRDGKARGLARDANDERHGKSDEEPEWEEVLGFGADGLSKMLTPGRAFNKRRFELGIDHLVFLGAPRFVREDGLWKKRKKTKRRVSADEPVQNELPEPQDAQDIDVADISNINGPSQAELQRVPVFDAAYGHGLMSGAASRAASDVGSDSTNGAGSDLLMFNVVFVLNPPFLEYAVRVEDMYDNVVKKFAKVLKYEQEQSNYVYKESRLILSIKDKGKEQQAPIYKLWPTILKNSPLAKAIAITFDAISKNKIAHVIFSMDFDTSIQIPQAIATSAIATPYDPQMPGLWLTTATMLEDEEDPILSPHSALLLLEDDDALLKEVEVETKELSGPLSYLIRNLTPTKSLQKLSQMHAMSLKDLEFLARHLIFWRRARAIPPLRPRHTYIVSPNADFRALSTAIPAFAARFPTLPPLPKILHSLSGTPRPYSILMPTRDHRPAYMEILAWLMRGGWVTQLRSFGWVRVSREVKAAVAAKMEKEEKERKSAPRHSTDSNGMKDEQSEDNGEEGTENPLKSPLSYRSPEDRNSIASESGITSPRLSAHFSSRSGPPSDAGSASSGRTAIPSNKLSPLIPSQGTTLKKPSPLHLTQSASPRNTSEVQSSPLSLRALSSPDTPDSFKDSSHLDPSSYTVSLVNSPQKANELEARWIEFIGESFEDEELREMWPLMLRYFDGRHALEGIAVREGLKKKKVGQVLGKLVAGGWLMSVRHW